MGDYNSIYYNYKYNYIERLIMEIDTKQMRQAAMSYKGTDPDGQDLAKMFICVADYIDTLRLEIAHLHDIAGAYSMHINRINNDKNNQT